jgi:hypothetical protein
MSCSWWRIPIHSSHPLETNCPHPYFLNPPPWHSVSVFLVWNNTNGENFTPISTIFPATSYSSLLLVYFLCLLDSLLAIFYCFCDQVYFSCSQLYPFWCLFYYSSPAAAWFLYCSFLFNSSIVVVNSTALAVIYNDPSSLMYCQYQIYSPSFPLLFFSLPVLCKFSNVFPVVATSVSTLGKKNTRLDRVLTIRAWNDIDAKR